LRDKLNADERELREFVRGPTAGYKTPGMDFISTVIVEGCT
jgi:hypothetical protein